MPLHGVPKDGVPKDFWIAQLKGDLADNVRHLLNVEYLNEELSKKTSGDDDFPTLLPSAKVELVAESQMFFDEPWLYIDYADRDLETTSLYNEYRHAIATQLGDQGVDMDTLFKLNRETMYDDFPDAWDSPVAYELGERVHLWVAPDRTWFLGTFQEDKELPIELRIGCFSTEDMRALNDHMSAFSAG